MVRAAPAYFFLIMAANRSIRIQSPFFIPDESISEALKSARSPAWTCA